MNPANREVPLFYSEQFEVGIRVGNTLLPNRFVENIGAPVVAGVIVLAAADITTKTLDIEVPLLTITREVPDYPKNRFVRDAEPIESEGVLEAKVLDAKEELSSYSASAKSLTYIPFDPQSDSPEVIAITIESTLDRAGSQLEGQPTQVNVELFYPDRGDIVFEPGTLHGVRADSSGIALSSPQVVLRSAKPELRESSDSIPDPLPFTVAVDEALERVRVDSADGLEVDVSDSTNLWTGLSADTYVELLNLAHLYGVGSLNRLKGLASENQSVQSEVVKILTKGNELSEPTVVIQFHDASGNALQPVGMEDTVCSVASQEAITEIVTQQEEPMASLPALVGLSLLTVALVRSRPFIRRRKENGLSAPKSDVLNAISRGTATPLEKLAVISYRRAAESGATERARRVKFGRNLALTSFAASLAISVAPSLLHPVLFKSSRHSVDSLTFDEYYRDDLGEIANIENCGSSSPVLEVVDPQTNEIRRTVFVRNVTDLGEVRTEQPK